MLLFCGECYKRGGVAAGLTEHGEGKDHGAYGTPFKRHKGRWAPSRKNGIARRITARCLVCQYRDKNGFIVAIRKNKVD